jgi:hypothetical protein
VIVILSDSEVMDEWLVGLRFNPQPNQDFHTTKVRK